MKRLKRSSIEVWRYFEETKRTMGFEIWMATDGSTSGLWFRMGTLVSKWISWPYLNYCQFYYNQSTYKGLFSNYSSQSKWSYYLWKVENRQKRVFPSNLIWILNLVFYFGFLIHFYSFTPIFLIGIINSFIYVQSKAFNSRKLILTAIKWLSIQKVEQEKDLILHFPSR